MDLPSLKAEGTLFPLNKMEKDLCIWLREDDGFYFLFVMGEIICRQRIPLLYKYHMLLIN